MAYPVLTGDEIEQRMAALPGWAHIDGKLTRTFRCATFADAIALVNRSAGAAERLNHHPDIDIRYTTVVFATTTHDSGGITEQDFQLAAEIGTGAVAIS